MTFVRSSGSKETRFFLKFSNCYRIQLLGGVGMPDLTDEQSELMEKENEAHRSIIDSMTAKSGHHLS